MKRRAILEYTVPQDLTDYIEEVGYPSNGGEMMRQVERIHGQHGNSGAYYATSLFAEHLGVSYLYIRLNNRIRVVNWYRDEDNEPRVLRDDQLDDDIREELLMRLAEQDLIIPYLEDYWLDRYKDDQDSIYYRAADRQRNGDAQTFAADPPADIQAEPLDPAPTASDTTEPEPATTEPEPEVTPTSGTGSALDRFANSGKRGLSNNPEEVEAIEELQTFLVELGLDVGNNGVDGKYGPRTTQAVKDFQNSMPGLAIDGDAGPDTIRAIRELQTDLSRIQELIDIMNESAIPFTYKSGLAKLLERDLTREERTQLEDLLDKYEIFRQEFPEYQTMLFSNAENAVTGAAEPGPTTTEPEAGAEAGAGNVQPRPTSSGRNGRAAQLRWDRQHAETHNPDGTPKSGAEEPEAGAEVEWEELTPNAAPEGYTLFIKRQETPVFTYGLEGGEPVDTEYASMQEAIAAAREAAEEEQAAAQQQPADAGDPIPSQPNYTGNYREDLVQFYRSQMSRENAEAFVASISLDNKDVTQLMSLQTSITRVISVLSGNQRIPDAVGDPNGGQIVRRPQAVAILRAFKDQTILDAIRNVNQPEPAPTQTYNAGEMRNLINTIRGQQ
jgi:hypothetical protein